jgi:hypothetical protein
MNEVNGDADETMSQTIEHPPDKSDKKVYPPELEALLDKALKGDPTVLPEIKKAFDDHPEIAVAMGDLGQHAEQGFLSLAAGSNTSLKRIGERSPRERARIQMDLMIAASRARSVETAAAIMKMQMELRDIATKAVPKSR